MITFTTGKVGGGKTILACAQMAAKIAKGWGVATNIELDVDGLAAWMDHLKKPFHPRQYRYLDLENEKNFSKNMFKGLPDAPYDAHIDEAHIEFNAKDDAMLKKAFMPLIRYVTQSRKLCNNIHFITQAPETVVNQFRLQAQFGYTCVDMRHYSFPLVGPLPFMGLEWAKYDWVSEQVVEKGRTPISKWLKGVYSTRQFYDSMTRELAENMETFEPVTKENARNNNTPDRGNDRGWRRFFRLSQNRKELHRAQAERFRTDEQLARGETERISPGGIVIPEALDRAVANDLARIRKGNAGNSVGGHSESGHGPDAGKDHN